MLVVVDIDKKIIRKVVRKMHIEDKLSKKILGKHLKIN